METDKKTDLETKLHRRVERTPVERPEEGLTDDQIVIEEPLEIRLAGESLAVTMRTPGDDRELAAGFVLSEGVIETVEEVVSIRQGEDPLDYEPDHVVLVEVSQTALDRWRQRGAARREFRALSGCGLCGKASLRDVYQQLPTIEKFSVKGEFVATLPQLMLPHQRVFAATGGIHGAALFDEHGELMMVREDVGRHNAVDKVIGSSLLAGAVPLHRSILVVSSRAGFEIVQKAAMASIPVVVAVGAASSLAVDIAERAGIELFSFVSASRWNRHPGGG